jgi:hypothetical protein
MNYMHRLADFDTIEQGEKNLAEATGIRDQMGGNLYWNICNDDCREISMKLEELRRKKQEDESTTLQPQG